VSYQSAPFWWVICDAPNCGVKSTEGGDYAAWDDASGARDDAIDSGWVSDADDQRHYCDDHHRYVCGECEKAEGREYSADHEGMCDECWAEDIEQNQESPAVTP
jgi:hypothetical protein